MDTGSFSNGRYNHLKRKGKPFYPNENQTLQTIEYHSSEDEYNDNNDNSDNHDLDDVEYEEEVTLDIDGTINTNLASNPSFDTPRTTTLITEPDTEYLYGIHDDDHHNLNGDLSQDWNNNDNDDDDMLTPEVTQYGQLSKPIITPLADDFNHDPNNPSIDDNNNNDDSYRDYDDNYNQYYDDINYAKSPPKKKKYRESDSNIKPPSYDEAKNIKDNQIKEKYHKRYSKYDNSYDYESKQENINDDNNMSQARITEINDLQKDKNGYNHDRKNGYRHHNKKHKKRHRKHNSSNSLDLSVTNEIDDNSDDSHYAKYEKSEISKNDGKGYKELSNFYNKKTKDKYDRFEMNTYDSSDSTSDSDRITQKYLAQPITPAPNDLNTKYGLTSGDDDDDDDDIHYEQDSNEDDLGFLPSPKPTTNNNTPNYNNTLYYKNINQLSPSPPKQPPKIVAKKSDIEQQQQQQQPHDDNNNKSKKKKKFTLKEFMSVDLERFVKSADFDNFDIAKSICKYYDLKCGDTDTVTIVADRGRGPNTAYWSKGDYNRVNKNCLGKYIMIYRACKHCDANIKVKQDIFESCVKGLCMDNLGHSQLIADKLDCIFGEGCHVSLASHDNFEVFCRYSDGYICEVELPSNDFVVAWRR